MKRNLILMCIVTLVSCSNHEDYTTVLQMPDSSPKEEIRTYEEALQVALSSMEMLESSDVTRSSSERRIDKSDSKIYMKTFVSRSSSDITNDTLMYVFNFADNEGFAIVSASKKTDALIAVTEKGHYMPGVPSGIDGFDEFMELAEKYVIRGSGAHLPTGPNDSIMSVNVITEEIDTIVGPYITVCWGYSHPEGELCPNLIAGCTNIAMAQVMSYYQYPSVLDITYPDADVTLQALDWTAINSHGANHLKSNCPNLIIHKAISRMIRQIGHLTNSSYASTTGTSTSLYSIPPAIAALGYCGGTITDYSDHYIRSQLNNNRLLLVTGCSSDGNGHTWNLDGYKYYLRVDYCYQSIGNGPWILSEIITTEHHYNHFNWGYYGENNGYYNSGVFNIALGIQYDGTTNEQTGNYSYDVHLINMCRN